MKKYAILLAFAALQAGSAHALSAATAVEDGAAAVNEAREAIEGAKGRTVSPGGSGAAINGATVIGNTSTQAVGTETKDSTVVSPVATGVDSHVTCPGDSPMGELSASQRSAIYKANALGIGGKGMCLENFKSKEVAERVANVEAAGVAALEKLGIKSARPLSNEELKAVAVAEEQQMVKEGAGSTLEEAADRLKQTCPDANNCDIESPEVCAVL